MLNLVSLPYVDPRRTHDFPGVQVASRLAIGLPLYPQLADRDIERVITTLREVGDATRPGSGDSA
jgi:hypothetical protein